MVMKLTGSETNVRNGLVDPSLFYNFLGLKEKAIASEGGYRASFRQNCVSVVANKV